MASIIEREVNQDQYRAKVARVLYNRLDKGMQLGSTRPSIYAENLEHQHDDAGGPREQVAVQHLHAQGPAAGTDLGPGQGGAGGRGQPGERGNWLYFVTVNFDTGETKFADDRGRVPARSRPSSRRWCQSQPRTL